MHRAGKDAHPALLQKTKHPESKGASAMTLPSGKLMMRRTTRAHGWFRGIFAPPGARQTNSIWHPACCNNEVAKIAKKRRIKLYRDCKPMIERLNDPLRPRAGWTTTPNLRLWMQLTLLGVLLLVGLGGSALGHPIISEFLASNTRGLLDEDRQTSDWIELYNPTFASIDLGNYALTDTAGDLLKWKFPSTNLASGQFMVVFASGKNRRITGQPLHTSFSLAATGEYLALTTIDETTIVSEFGPVYPAQSPDISYGWIGSTNELATFFNPPTPGQPNPMVPFETAANVGFSLPSGGYATNTTVILSSSETNGFIRFTINGTEPKATSPVYVNPLQIFKTTVVRARVFAPDKAPGPLRSETYHLIEPGLASFSSNLPLLILSTFGAGVSESTKTITSFTLAEPRKDTGRTTLTSPATAEGRGVIKVRGSSSLQFPKHSLAFEIQDEFGADRKMSLLGLPEESDWVLYAPYTEKTLIRDVLSYELFGKMGHYSVRTRYVEVFLDTSGNKVATSDYAGVYILVEKIKRGKDRVDIQQLLPSHSTPPEVTGGYIFKKDRLDPGDSGFFTPQQQLAFVEPKEQEITKPQRSYLSQFFGNFETALYGANFANPTNGWLAYIDASSFIDNHLLVEGTKNIDGYRLSSYMFKDRDQKLKMGPAWDFNLVMGNANYLNGWLTNGWYYDDVGDAEYPWYRRLFQDPNFKQMWIDRWAELRDGPWSTTSLLRSVDEKAAYLNEAQARNYRTWPILGTYVWPNWYIGNTYAEEVDWMKQWIVGRMAWMDGQNARRPKLSRATGPVASGDSVLLSGPSTPIYFTTDGSDPRLPGGAISLKAKIYSVKLTITNNVRIVARAKTLSGWSAPLAASYIVNPSPLIITEIMYHPAVADTGFIELMNTGKVPLPLVGFKISGGIDFDFNTSAITQILPGARVVVVANLAAFNGFYGNTNNVAGVYKGSLSNSKAQLILTGPMGEPILDFSYEDNWCPATDGKGFSLVIRDEQGDPALWNLSRGWRASGLPNGTPAGTDPGSSIPEIWINEILTRSTPPFSDTIEIYNPGNSTADISNWILSDETATTNGYVFPADSKIAPNEYLIVTGDQLSSTTATRTGFSLRAAGETVYLWSADTNHILTGYANRFNCQDAFENVSFGRQTRSDGKLEHPPQKRPTFGRENFVPKVGPLVITEIFASPNVPGHSFIELKNVSLVPLTLAQPGDPAKTWEIAGIDFQFPTAALIPADGFALIVKTNPAGFRTRFQVPAEVPIFGPFLGELNAFGEELSILQPQVHTNSLGVTQILKPKSDEVAFLDSSAWPGLLANGDVNIERVFLTGYGKDPANWREPPGGISPGRYNVNAAKLPPALVINSPNPVYDGVRSLLAGWASRDTALDGGPVTVEWSLTSGPAPLEFESRQSESTVARFRIPGIYDVRFSASDGFTNTSISKTISVLPNSEYQQWATSIFNPSQLADPVISGMTADPDSDGATNADEWLAGTDPLDGKNFLGLNLVSASANGIALQFQGQTGLWYAVQKRGLVKDSEWETLATVAGSASVQITVPVQDASSYFRVSTLPAQ